ncbi:MAG: hypothetical protein PHO02_06350 [Candidatus Nanoarchaeia archaeon]|nr:hypothetical protein [Candidatus Nanoarchaeia archaeon]
MKVKFVDGHKIRMSIDTDFCAISSWKRVEYIPKGEIWIDKAYRTEADWLKRMHLFEQKLLPKMKYSEARKLVCKKFIRKAKIIPRFVLKTECREGLKINYVEGCAVRNYIDPKFVLGGHDLVYDYIPKNEVWIDSCQGKKEAKYTIIHEIYERNLMKKGMDYNSAHDFALAAEKYERRKDGAVYPDD